MMSGKRPDILAVTSHVNGLISFIKTRTRRQVEKSGKRKFCYAIQRTKTSYGKKKTNPKTSNEVSLYL